MDTEILLLPEFVGIVEQQASFFEWFCCLELFHASLNYIKQIVQKANFVEIYYLSLFVLDYFMKMYFYFVKAKVSSNWIVAVMRLWKLSSEVNEVVIQQIWLPFSCFLVLFNEPQPPFYSSSTLLFINADLAVLSGLPAWKALI